LGQSARIVTRIGLYYVALVSISGLLWAAGDRELFEKARSFERAGDWVAAETAYRSYIKDNPAIPEALGNLGVVLGHQAKYDQAIEVYRQALHVQPDLYAIHLNLGLAYYKIGHRELAIPEFQA